MRVYSWKKLAGCLLRVGVCLLNGLLLYTGSGVLEKLLGFVWLVVAAVSVVLDLPPALSEKAFQKRENQRRIGQLAWERRFGRLASKLQTGGVVVLLAAVLGCLLFPGWLLFWAGILCGVCVCFAVLSYLARGAAKEIAAEEAAKLERGES